jgi:hypothetical protein
MSKALSTNRMDEQMSEANLSTSSTAEASYEPWVSPDQAEVHFILERASRYFSLLAEPARLRILQAVCDKECSVQEIVGQTSLPQPNVFYSMQAFYRVDATGLLFFTRSQIRL